MLDHNSALEHDKPDHHSAPNHDTVLDYDREADDYDASRGGEARARAAADAVERLLPPDTRTLLDLACGTGIVTTRLRHPTRAVLGLDRAHRMTTHATRRLPGAIARADATRLPLATASTDAIVIIWLLHLLADAAPVIAQTARALRPGGILITTANKDAAAFHPDDDTNDIATVLIPHRTRPATDDADHLTALAAHHGLHLHGDTTFTGAGQGRSPRHWRDALLAGRIPWVADPARAADQLAELPDQDRPRPDPRYRLIALRKNASSTPPDSDTAPPSG